MLTWLGDNFEPNCHSVQRVPENYEKLILEFRPDLSCYSTLFNCFVNRGYDTSYDM
jgi:hypothetical protein